MPTVRVDWLVGRSSAQRRALAHVLTAEVCRIAGCQPESVDVIFTDASPGHWSNAVSGRQPRDGTADLTHRKLEP